MIILGIETSSKIGSIGLIDNNNPLAEMSFATQIKPHSERLLPIINTLLNEAELSVKDIELVGVDIGPGSFTGLRVGLAVAKGLCFARNIPIVGVNSLKLLASQLGEVSVPIIPVIDAKREQYYTAIYKQGTEISPPTLLDCDQLMKRLSNLRTGILLGYYTEDFAENLKRSLRNRFIIVCNRTSYITGLIVGTVAGEKYKHHGEDNLDSLQPLYVREGKVQVG